MELDFHIWETADGRLVAHGDPDAAILKYPAGVNIPERTVEAHGIDKLVKAREGVEDAPAAKRGRRPADKQADKPADKGGVTVNRLKDADEG